MLPFLADPSSAAAGDVNGDGRLDLVFTHDQGKASALLGAGNGTFPTAPLDVGPEPYATHAALLTDVDRDGRVDLVMRDTTTPAIVVRFGVRDGLGSPTYHEPTDDEVTPIAGLDTGGLLLQSFGGRLLLMPGDCIRK